MRLWSLQALIIALAFLVGWGLANFPTMRAAPSSLQRMCDKAAKDELSRGACDIRS